MSRSVHSVKLQPYNSSSLNALTYSLGDVVFDADNLTLRLMDGNTQGGYTLATRSWVGSVFTTLFGTNQITIGNTTDSAGTTTGALQVRGGLGIAKNVYVGQTVNANGGFFGNLTGTLLSSSQPNITSLGTLAGVTSSGQVVITNNTATNALGQGALQVSGGASIAGNLYVGGSLNITGSNLTIDNVSFNNGLTLSGNTSPGQEYLRITDGAVSPITKFLVDTATGNTTISGTLGLTGDFTLNTNKFTVTASTGATAVAGDFSINTNKFTVASTTGNTVVAGSLTANSLTVNTTSTFGGFPLQVASVFVPITVDTDCGVLGSSLDAFGADITSFSNTTDCMFRGPITTVDLETAGTAPASPI
jgi:hypothetical protein